MARTVGLKIGFVSWLMASAVPTLAAMVLLPYFLYKIISPEVKATPEAPAAARKALAALGPLTRQERIVTATFMGSVITPQGSSANVLFAGSGYLSQGDLHRLGAITTAVSLLVYPLIGTPRLMMVAR